MDREAAVIRSEMSRTRADLDVKLSRLRERAKEMSPRRYARQLVPEYFLDRAVGVALVLTGLALARRGYRRPRR